MVDALNGIPWAGLPLRSLFYIYAVKSAIKDTFKNSSAVETNPDTTWCLVMDHSPANVNSLNGKSIANTTKVKYKLSDAGTWTLITRQVELVQRYSATFRERLFVRPDSRIKYPSRQATTTPLCTSTCEPTPLNHFKMVMQNFPTTAEAASPLTQQGMTCLNGRAKMLVPWCSHSEATLRHETGKARWMLDILSNDYLPLSGLLESAFSIASVETNDYDVPKSHEIGQPKPCKRPQV